MLIVALNFYFLESLLSKSAFKNYLNIKILFIIRESKRSNLFLRVILVVEAKLFITLFTH